MNPSRLRNLLLLLAALSASIALAACGGDDETTGDSTEAPPTETSASESGDAEVSGGSPDEVTKDFLLAIAGGDGETACGLASETALEAIEASGPCEEQVTQALGALSKRDRADVEDASFETTEEDGSTANVTATKPDGTEETFSLTVEDGEWKIDG